jgi:dTDP-L-rhamnose 4-epimerase
LKVLVTGAAGFIGSNMVDRLLRDGHEVTGIDSLDPCIHDGPPDYRRREARYLWRDLRHWQADSECRATEAVIHLAASGGVQRAAREPAEIIDNNVRGTARLAEQARSCSNLRHFLVMSSFSVYGDAFSYRSPNGALIPAERRITDMEAGRFNVYCPDSGLPGNICPVDEGTQVRPRETYGASKAMQELCLADFAANSARAVQPLILRAFSVVGSGMRWDHAESTIIARLAGWLARGQAPTLFEDGQQIRDWVSVFDVTEAVSRVLSGLETASVINVCSGHPTTLREACRMLGEALSRLVEPLLPGTFRLGDMRDCLGNSSRFTELLGRQPSRLAEVMPMLGKDPTLTGMTA